MGSAECLNKTTPASWIAFRVHLMKMIWGHEKKHHSPPLFTPPSKHQYSGMQLCLVWKCKSPFVAIIYGLRRLSRVFSPLVHYYTITVHGLLTPLSALTGFLKGYATSLPYQCGWGPANVLISHLVPFHSGRMSTAQFQKGKLQIIIHWKLVLTQNRYIHATMSWSHVQAVLSTAIRYIGGMVVVFNDEKRC